MSWYTHHFEAVIERHGVGRTRKIWYRVVFLPSEMAAELPFGQFPQLRIEGEIADIPVKSAFIGAGDGRYYVIVSPALLKAAGVSYGDVVEMRFRVADQDAVDMPQPLSQALQRDRRAGKAFSAH
jgi:hypothetical protein